MSSLTRHPDTRCADRPYSSPLRNTAHLHVRVVSVALWLPSLRFAGYVREEGSVGCWFRGGSRGGGYWGSGPPPPPPLLFGGTSNFIKRGKKRCAQKRRILVLNSLIHRPPFPKSCICPCVTLGINRSLVDTHRNMGEATDQYIID